MKNKDKHINQSNFLSSMLVGGSAVGGSAYFMSRFAKQHIKPSKQSTFVSPKLRFSASDAAPNEFVTELTRTLEGASLAKTAWKKAVEAIDPNAAQTLSFAGNISELEGAAVGSAIQQTMNANQSMYMGQIFSRFKQNVGALSRQVSKTGSLPAFQDVSGVSLPAGRSLNSSQLPGGLKKSVNKIKKALGDNFAQVVYHTRDGWEQDGLGLYAMKFNYKGGSFNLKVPSVSNGVLVEGRTQSSKRIAPSVAIFDPKTKTITSTMPRDRYFMENFQQSILPKIASGEYKNSGEVQSAIDELYSNEIYSLESVPNAPRGVQHEGLSRFIGARSKAVDIRVLDDKGFRKPTDKEFTTAMKQGGFIPSTSGSNLAEGRVSTLNAAEWSMTPTAVDYSRSPGQAIREWKATPEASQALLDSGRIKFNKVFDTLERTRDLGSRPGFNTLYIDPARPRNKKLLEGLRIDEGESLISNAPDVRRMNRASRLAPGVHLKTIRSDLTDIISGNKAIQPGEILGWTTEGTPFSFKNGMKLQKFIEHESTGRGEYGTLLFEEMIEGAEATKVFGDIKGMQRSTNPWDVSRRIARETNNALFTNNIEVWAMADDLRKDTSKHNKQMITAMHEVLSGRNNLSRKASIFLNNPRVYARMLERQANAGGSYNHAEFVKGMMRFGLTEANLNPQEFGAVFGLVPSSLGKKGVRQVYGELAMNEFSFRHMREMYRGMARGVSQTTFNASNAGGFGSLEPRAFELLQAGQYGALGSEISSDLMGRMIASNPETLYTHEALTKTLTSLAGRSKATGKIWDIKNRGYDSREFQAFIEGGGGFVRPGSGLADIYVPGAEEAAGMSLFKTGGGDAIKGNLARKYHDITRGLSSMYSDVDSITTEKGSQLLNEFAADIQREQAPLGKGMGSLLRGKEILGSRMLTGVSEAGGQYTTNPFTIGLSESYATQMFDDLADRGFYNAADVKAMRDQFFSGKTVGGVVGRHPLIGQYSLQPVNFQILRGVEDSVMTIPSTAVNMRFGGENVPVNISPLTGMAGDKDADMFSAFLVSPDLEKKIRNQFVNQDNEYTRAYMQHNVRMQMIKAKAKGVASGLSNQEKMIADAKKLGTGQTWVGKLSVDLSAMRQGVSANMKGQMRADAMFLLEWLEQVPISGKHLDPKRVYEDEMSALFLQLSSAAREKNAPRMVNVVQDILKNSDPTSRRLLTESLAIEDGSETIAQLTGVNIGNELQGINVEETVAGMMSSMNKIEESGMSKISRQLAGRGKTGIADLGKYLSMSARVVETGSFSSLTSSVLSNKNALLGAGIDAIKSNKGKIGFGFLGALALGTALSSPTETIGPAGGIQASVNTDYASKAPNRMNMEPMSPSSQPLGNPTPPDMLRSRRSMIQPGGNSARMHVRTRTSGNNTNRIISGIRSNNRDSNVSISVRDSSSILNLHGIANKVMR